MTNDNLEKIADDLSSLSLLEAAELCKLLKKRWSISDNSLEDTPKETRESISNQKTEFNVILSKVGSNKIGVIKEVRNFTGLGLIESKNLVEKSPSILKEGIGDEEARRIQEAFEKIGAEITLE